MPVAIARNQSRLAGIRRMISTKFFRAPQPKGRVSTIANLLKIKVRTNDRGTAGRRQGERWGFWKCHDRLRAQGYDWNHKRTWRVYCQLRLNLPRRTKHRVPTRVRKPLLVEPRMNAVWAIDFMRDTLYSGRVFRTLNVIDEANRGALGIDVAASIPAARVAYVSGTDDRLARSTERHSLRQRTGAHQRHLYEVVQGTGHRAALHLAGQARPERLHRALQSNLPRRGLERLPVRLFRRDPRDHRRMVGAVQRNQTARRAGKPAASALPRAVARCRNSSLELST